MIEAVGISEAVEISAAKTSASFDFDEALKNMDSDKFKIESSVEKEFDFDAELNKMDLVETDNTEEILDNSEKSDSNSIEKRESELNDVEQPEAESVPEETDNNSETNDEINEKQLSAIKEAFERIKNGEKLSKEELGNLGEMMMDQYYISQGYTPLNMHRVTSLDDKKEGFKTGIDGVYEKTNPDGTKSYVIADAKYNTSPLGETNDGKQMSENWIDKRLDDSVGIEKADEIRSAAEDNPDSVKHEIYHIDPTADENGNMHTDVQNVDSDGNKIGEKTTVETYDANGNNITGSSSETEK